MRNMGRATGLFRRTGSGTSAQTFTSSGLREHTRQREFTQTAWPSEEQRMWDASAAESAPQRGDNALVAEKFRKGHGQALWPGSRTAWVKITGSTAARTSWAICLGGRISPRAPSKH